MKSPRPANGFTLLEMMVAVAIVTLLAAIAIPNFIQRMDRARESGTKENMSTLQLMAEDYAVQNGGAYSAVLDDGHIGSALPPGFRNPYDNSAGNGSAWEDRASVSDAPSLHAGIVSYADSDTVAYNIKGSTRAGALNLVLSSGR